MVTGCYTQRDIVHLNVADFAVAVERLNRPGLHDRPVIVSRAQGGRARVYDMSEEAFQAGVRKHMSLDQARRMCGGVRIVPPKPHKYEKAMLEMMKMALPYSPLVESEEDTGHVFMDLSGTGRLFGPARDVAWRMKKEVKKRLGLEPIWGLAPNKMLAKAATRVVKPKGEHIVRPGGEQDFLRSLPLSLLPGLETPDLTLFRQYNLHTVEEALTWRKEHLLAVFGKRGGEIHQLLQGRDDSKVLPVGLKPPVVRLDHEFSQDTNHLGEVERALFGLVEKAGRRLRRMGKAARRVAVYLTYSDGGRVIRQRSHALGTANDFLLFDLARSALAVGWARRVRLRHLRLACDRLVYPPAQLDLPFMADATDLIQRKQAKLMHALDRIRDRHGERSICLGRSLGD